MEDTRLRAMCDTAVPRVWCLQLVLARCVEPPTMSADEAATAAASEPNTDIEVELRECEDKVNASARDMGRLRGEFAFNLRKLQDSYYPRVFPYLNAVHMNSYYQQLLDAEIQWLEKKVVAMEQHKASFFELRDLATARKELFDSLNPLFEEAFLTLEQVTRDELAVLRGYDNPPQVVLDTIATVMTVRGEDDTSLEAARVMLSETYYYCFFISKCRSRVKMPLEEAQANALEKFLLNPESTPANVARASTPCGAMAKWLAALNLYFHYERITEPKKTTLDETKDELMALRLRLQEKREEIRGAKEKLDELNDEMRAAERDLRDRYDLTMVPLHDSFLDAHGTFNDAFCSPRRRIEEGHSPRRDDD